MPCIVEQRYNDQGILYHVIWGIIGFRSDGSELCYVPGRGGRATVKGSAIVNPSPGPIIECRDHWYWHYEGLCPRSEWDCDVHRECNFEAGREGCWFVSRCEAPSECELQETFIEERVCTDGQDEWYEGER